MKNWDNKKLKSSDLIEDDHTDARWLVSYADVMTLLFGLFVILFSVAMEKQNQFQDNLKSISDSLTGSPTKDEIRPGTQTNLNLEQDLAEALEKAAMSERLLAIERAKFTAVTQQLHALKKETANVKEILLDNGYFKRRIVDLEKRISYSGETEILLTQKTKALEEVLGEKAKLVSEIAKMQEPLRKLQEYEGLVVQLEEQLKQCSAKAESKGRPSPK